MDKWRWLRGVARWPARLRTTGLLVMAVVAVATVGVVFGVPGVARFVAGRKLVQAGATGEIGTVRLGARGLWLSEVRLRRAPRPEDRGMLGRLRLEGRLDEVLIPWSAVLGTRTVALAGGELALTWVPTEPRERDSRRPTGSDLLEQGGLQISFERLNVTLRRAEGAEVVTIHGMHGVKSAQTLAVGWEDAGLVAPAWRAATRNVSLKFARGVERKLRLAAGDVTSMRVSVNVTPIPGAPDQAATSSQDEDNGVSPQQADLVVWLERLTQVPGVGVLERARIAQVAEAIEPGAELRVAQLEVGLEQGKEQVWLRPLAARLARSTEAMAAQISSQSEMRPLKVGVEIPLGEDKGPRVAIDFPPIALSVLGLEEGDFGLLGVRDARVGVTGHLELKADEQRLDWQFRAKAERLAVDWPWLASSPVREVGATADLAGSYHQATRHFDFEVLNVSLGALTTRLHGELAATPDRARFAFQATVPLVACQDLLDALPLGLAPRLVGMRADGTLSFDGRVSFDSQELARTSVDLTLRNNCRITQIPAGVDPSRFRGPFTLDVDDGSGTLTSLAFGPGTAGWVSATEISPLLGAALQVCEDGRFLRHRGLDIEALRNSLKQNLMEGRFVRGGSTLTMQLAKNLYLRREKTLARKLEEAVLTTMLEQTLNKAQILELYLNVVEFGRGLYGIRPASYAYFGTSPDRLTPGQAFFLASILPNPKASHFLPDGTLSPGWKKHLNRLLGIAKERALISVEELQQGLDETIALGRAGSGDSPTADAAATPSDATPRSEHERAIELPAARDDDAAAMPSDPTPRSEHEQALDFPAAQDAEPP